MKTLPSLQLSQDQEERSQRLHTDCIVFDLVSQHAGGNIFGHYPPKLLEDLDRRISSLEGLDRLAETVYWPYEMALLGRSQLVHEWLLESGLTCGTYSIDVHDGHDPQMRRWEDLVLRYKELPWVKYVTTATEIRDAKKNGHIAYYAQCQPTTPAPRSLDAFDAAYVKGLRSFMLTYNQMDNIGVGCTERVDAGLSLFGLDVVDHCNRIGMMVDVSHCGEATTLDACQRSRKPVNANHTAAFALHAHARCKSDEALRAIAGTGGIIGIVTVPFFLSDRDQPSLEDMLDHIDYIADLVGWRHVALGTDWPIQAPDETLNSALGAQAGSIGFRPEDRVAVAQRLVGFDDCRDLPNITRGLVKRGYDDEQIAGILGKNALRVFEEVCGA